jgi:hypothetical protein
MGSMRQQLWWSLSRCWQVCCEHRYHQVLQ